MKNLRLKLARVEKDMTQGGLAEAIGVNRQTIGLIEAGKYNPSLSLCLSICHCLGKSLDQLFWEEPTNEKNCD
ncbi:helix-turn-helix transcriptional regulator [Streptococcus parasuis]|uniref:helix-turn-helix transcriptional regulator n=1 Tax=Streptococcus parasuis TaxID=1501662 RepID=UPI002FDF53AF